MDHISKTLTLLTLLSFITGCTTNIRRICLNDLHSKKLEEFEFATERPSNKPPSIGLALSGGGTRAASFSIGILQGLHEQGILQKTDIISSVSGGGYAAYYYFNKLIAPRTEFDYRGIGAIFEDCLPIEYKGICGVQEGETCPFLGLDRSLKVCKTKAHAMNGDDPYKFQGYLRGFQDILSESSSYNTGNNSSYLPSLIASVGYLPINFLGNVLLDERLIVSPTKTIYTDGILRTYGTIPKKCEVPDSLANTGECIDKRSPPPEQNPIKEMQKLCILFVKSNFENNKNYINLCKDWEVERLENESEQTLGANTKIPLWIINTTTGYSNTSIPFIQYSGKNDIGATTFEITPLGARSILYGEFNGLREMPPEKFQPKLKLHEAVVSSGAFFDPQQRDYKFLQGPMIPILNAVSFSWGTDLDNLSVGRTMRYLHRALPFPFYYLQGYDQDQHAVYIHLSDGGQTENLGLWALARRGVKDIIVVDAGLDREGYLWDLCRVQRALRDRGLELRFPKLQNFSSNKNTGFWYESLCHETLHFEQYGGNLSSPNSRRHGYDIFKWRNPIVQGCIVKPDLEKYNTESKIKQRLDDGTDSFKHAPCYIEGNNYPDATQNPGCPESEKEGLRSRVWLIKLAANTEVDQALPHAANSCRSLLEVKENSNISKKYSYKECEKALNHPKNGKGVPLPIELVAYCSTHANCQLDSNGEPSVFPQDDTVAMTANSDAFKYGGYRELGRWFAHHLIIDNNKIKMINYEEEQPLIVKNPLYPPDFPRGNDSQSNIHSDGFNK